MPEIIAGFRMLLSILTILLAILDYTGSASSHQDGDNGADADSGSDGIHRAPRDISRRLVVTTVLREPYMMLKESRYFLVGNDRFEGYMADLVARLAARINFDYELRLARDNKYGSLDPEVGWTGMIGEVYNGDAEIAAAPLTVTAERSAVVDFSSPVLTFRSTALLKQTSTSDISSIETAEDLIQSDIPYGVIAGSTTHDQLQRTTDPVYRGMFSRLMSFWPPATVSSIQEGLERVRMQRYAFIVDVPTAEYLLGREPCDLFAVEPFLAARSYALATRRGGGLRELINRELRDMRANGELQEIFLKWWDSHCARRRAEQDEGRRDRADGEGEEGGGGGGGGSSSMPPWRYATAAQSHTGGAARTVGAAAEGVVVWVGVVLVMWVVRR